MHDLILAREILKNVLRYSQKFKLKKIKKVKIELGEIIEHNEKIRPKNLKYFLKLLSKKTKLEKAKIEIKKISGHFWRIKEIIGN